jgi:hypothetical protein
MSKKQKPKVAVKETAPYDNFMDQMREEVIVEKNDTLWGEEEKIVEDLEEWKKHWIGMPGFEQEDKKPYKTIYVHFRNEEDYKAFAKLVDIDLKDKTKSTWYPKREVQDLWSLRWIEKDD